MNSINIENILNRKGVKPTSNRILVARELMKASHPISLADLEILLGFSMDKASIFRVLELFSEKEIPFLSRKALSDFWAHCKEELVPEDEEPFLYLCFFYILALHL